MPILQSHIPQEQLDAAAARLPAMRPVAMGDWLVRDEVYAAQIAQKARLIGEARGDVIACLPEAEAAANELCALVTGQDDPDPLLALSRVAQEDFCILQKRGAEHVLTAALLAFPAGWTLREKIGHPLGRIHAPVEPYDDNVGKRVQRLFDGMRDGVVLWRANLLRYDDPTLFQPHLEAQPRAVGHAHSPYWRSERQSLLKLPISEAVVFSIHTSVIEA